MTSPPDTPDEAMLRRLAQMDMAAAEKAHAALMAAEKIAEIAEAMRTYQRAARSARQTLMLKARLEKMAAEAASRQALSRLTATTNAAFVDTAIEERVEALQDAVARVAAAAYPGEAERQEATLDEQDVLLDADAERPDFLRHPLEAQVADQCQRLGLPAELAARWRELPPAPWTAPAEDDLDEPCEPPAAAEAADSG